MAQIQSQPPDFRPYSTLAHEMGHILLDPLNPPNNSSLWGDNSTPFLHIETHIGIVKLFRRNPAGVGPVDPVVATDINRRNLIAFVIDDACVYARIHLPFVRPLLP